MWPLALKKVVDGFLQKKIVRKFVKQFILKSEWPSKRFTWMNGLMSPPKDAKAKASSQFLR